MGPYVFEGCDGFTEPVYNAHYYTQNPANPKIIHHIGDNSLLPGFADVRKYAAMSWDEVMQRRQK